MTETLDAAQRAAMFGPVASLRGRCPFTSARAMRGYRLNQFFWSLRHEANRERFTSQPEHYMTEHDLSDLERDLVRRRDYDGLLDYGACLLTMAKTLRVDGLTLVDFGAAARGQTTQAFVAQKRAESKGQPWAF